MEHKNLLIFLYFIFGTSAFFDYSRYLGAEARYFSGKYFFLVKYFLGMWDFWRFFNVEFLWHLIMFETEGFMFF